MSSCWPPDLMQWPLAVFELSLTVKYTYSTLSPATISLDTLADIFTNHSDVHLTLLLLLLILFCVKYQFFIPSHAAVAGCNFTQSLLCAALIYFSDWFCQKIFFLLISTLTMELVCVLIFTLTSSIAPSLFTVIHGPRRTNCTRRCSTIYCECQSMCRTLSLSA